VRCTERGANDDLAPALPGPLHKQVRDVGATDQQYAGNAAEEKEQGAADLADVVRLQGKDVEPELGKGRPRVQ
jgi:hypothetical protein